MGVKVSWRSPEPIVAANAIRACDCRRGLVIHTTPNR